MRIPPVLALCVVLSACKKEVPSKESPAAAQVREISIAEVIAEEKVLIGKLGVPFGTIVQVKCQGIVPSENELKVKAPTWDQDVLVLSVNGKPLDPPARLRWSAARADDSLKKPDQGKIAEVFGYETGMFSGVPDRLHEYAPSWADTNFHFHCSFIALTDQAPEEDE